MNKVISVIYVSRSGNTEQMVQAAAAGARTAGAQINFKEAGESTGADLEQCDGLIWGTGNYYGYMNGRLKDWFDRECMDLQKKRKAGEVRPRPYFCCLSATANPYRQLPTIENLSASMNLKKAFEPATSKGKPDDEVLARCHALGRDLVGIDVDEMVDLYVPVPRVAQPKRMELTAKPVIVMVTEAAGDGGTKALTITENRFTDYEVSMIPADDLEVTYRELLNQGRTNLVVAPLALTDTAWYHRVLTSAPAAGLNVEYTWPLLATPENVTRVGRVLTTNQAKEVKTVLAVAAGGETNLSLLLLNGYLRRRGGAAALDDNKRIADEIQESGSTHVSLSPLAMTPQNKATTDRLHELASILKETGISVQVESGLDYYARLLAIWLDDVERALDTFGEDTNGGR